MGALLGPDFPTDIALAVSGGGDSMAMLALAHDWARVFGVKLWVVTVDHGLREESADEAEMVARECALLGHPHATLRWHWDGQGNLQDAARRARLELIDRWRGGIEHVLMAHTQDDVAETFLMRLARGSGVEGLSAMAESRHVKPHRGSMSPLPPEDVTQTVPPPKWHQRTLGVPSGLQGFHLIRPLLRVSRSDLRHHIDTLKVPYVDDPSNEDPRFDRARTRQAIVSLGLDIGTLSETATRMSRASEALAVRAVDVARDVVAEDVIAGVPSGGLFGSVPSGDLLFDRDAFAAIERDTQMRLLAAALQWVSSNPYRPRSAPMEDLLEVVLAGGSGTLHGVRAIAEKANVRVMREYNAVKDLYAPLGSLWDNRWSLSVQGPDTFFVRALGPDGWQQVPEKPKGGLSQRAALALPSIFEGERLVACAGLGFGPTHSVLLRPPAGQFITFLVSR
ncbi:tRNA lysidine(34) synthetase TilS [Rhodobacterales bacterium HKCCE4037]|nr:tRNA lysidine(34) synthetase TilS [Rhodobacterales bacterium HKCCE4037]